MREALGDIWEIALDSALEKLGTTPVVCVTTNQQTNSRGFAVMGGGIAREARDRFAGIDSELGWRLGAGKVGVEDLGAWFDSDGVGFNVVAFPTKDHWRYNSKLELIERSARELVALSDAKGWKDVFLPRPGCGLGGRKWEDISKLVGPILDDRFVVVGFAHEAR